MDCPQCKLELFIKNSYTTVEDGKAVTIQDLYCRNKQCSFGRTDTMVKQIKHKQGGQPDKLDDLIICDNTILAKVGENSYFIPEYVESEISGTEAAVKCPQCGNYYSFSIDEKTEIRG